MSPDDLTLRTLTAEDYDAYYRHDMLTFNQPETAHERAAFELVFEPERMLGYFDDTRLVATAGIFTRDMTVPGGPIPMACVTTVGVHPLYRRRGLLTALMRRQLHDLHESGGEPVAALWASEAAIYGRFGYGPAAVMAQVEGERATLRIRPEHRPSSLDLRLGDPADPAVRADLARVYERARPHRPGFCDRRGNWWAYRCDDPEAERAGARALTAVLHDGPDGVDGYALYATKPGWKLGVPDGTVVIREIVADTPEAAAALWTHLLDLDLTTRVEWTDGTPDDPLPHLLINPRTLTISVRDNLWVRVVDLPRALRARSYGAPLDLVLGVRDELCPWNDGHWRVAADLDGATVERTDDDADVTMPVASLGALYLGRSVAGSLAAGGHIRERRPGAVARLHAAMSTPQAPFCPEVF